MSFPRLIFNHEFSRINFVRFVVFEIARTIAIIRQGGCGFRARLRTRSHSVVFGCGQE